MIDVFANIKNLISHSPGGILSKELVKGKASNVTLFCLAKDTEISEHTARKNAIVFVLEGKGEFVLAGKSIKMEEGVMIKMEKDSVHRLSANTNMSFLLFLVG